VLEYDLYNSWGKFSVAFQVASGGPELRYYPQAGLLNRTGDGIWLKVTERGATVLDGAIAAALSEKAAGHLEQGPVAAQFRAAGMMDASYYAFKYPAAQWQPGNRPRAASYDARGLYDPGRLLNVGGPIVRLTNNGAGFTRDYILPLIEAQPKWAPVTAPYAISYLTPAEGPVGGGGGAGFLGFYQPPQKGQPGRLWPEDNNYLSSKAPLRPYYETTPGFDALMTAGLNGNQAVELSSGKDAAARIPALALGAARLSR